MGPEETFEGNAVRELAEEMGIVIGSDLAPDSPEPLFDFWFEDDAVRNWGRLLLVRFTGELGDLRLQPEEVESVVWMDRDELRTLLVTGPVSPDAAVALRRWLGGTTGGGGADDASGDGLGDWCPPSPRPATAPPCPPGAFHPGIVCAVSKQLIVGYRYARPATAADRQAARDAGFDPTDAYSICQQAFDSLPPTEQRTFERIEPPVDPAKLALVAFASALALGLAGGVLSTAKLLDGRPNGAPPLDALPDYAEVGGYSPAEQLVALIFRPPR